MSVVGLQRFRLVKRPWVSRDFPQSFLRSNSSRSRKWSTPLAGHLTEAIKTTGPVSLAVYMRQCLTSPEGGYYTSACDGSDQFGKKGDFVTSPEISQIFGELIGIWVVTEWIAQGRTKQGVDLIELGPGRGTLMDDMLRTIRNFKGLASSISAVYLVEASPSLRDKQKQLLCGDAPIEETSLGFQSKSKHLGVPVVWCEHMRSIPKDTGNSPFMIAHEFFDALPIYAFQSVHTPKPAKVSLAESDPPNSSPIIPEWRELVVSHARPNSNSAAVSDSASQRADSIAPGFILSAAKEHTPYSRLFPESSARYKALRKMAGATIEICPEGISYAEEFAHRIGNAVRGAQTQSPSPSGAALIVDYGPADTIPTNSLRGIRAHQNVSPFSSPGLVDLSADVDFTALAEFALGASPNVEVHGPVEQAVFLHAMGIRERAEQLLGGVDPTEIQKRKRVESGWQRLVDRGGGGMGKLYKAMAIVPLSDGRRRPVGFGGEVPT